MRWFVAYALAVFVVITTPCVVSADDGRDSGSGIHYEGKPSEGYPWLVQGLEQFPRQYKLKSTKTLAVLLGCTQIFNDKGEEVGTEMRLVTIDDTYLTIKLHGKQEELSFFFNEVCPFWGKYRFWDTVLYLDKNPPREGWYYAQDIDTVGKFFAERDLLSHDMTGEYKNEVYER